MDGAIVAKRNLIKIKRVPDLLVFSTISPIMFILLFAYIFGSAIQTPGVNYKEFLMPGIFAQTMIFGATLTGSGHGRRHQEGHHRPVPLAADVPVGGADRAHRQRPGQQRADHRGDVG